MADIKHISPEGTYSVKGKGYTQAVEVRNAERMIFLSGHLPLDSAGHVVGTGSIERQARQVFENLRHSLASVGCGFEHVVKMTTFVTDVAQHPPVVRRVREAYLGAERPAASTMVEVPCFAHPDVMIEIDAIAMV